MYCRECGNKLADGGAFCSKCGTKVISDLPPPTSPVTNNTLAAARSESATRSWLNNVIKHVLKIFIGIIVAMIIPALFCIVFPYLAGMKVAKTVYVLSITFQSIGYLA